jgi:hypothetical protein
MISPPEQSNRVYGAVQVHTLSLLQVPRPLQLLGQPCATTWCAVTTRMAPQSSRAALCAIVAPRCWGVLVCRWGRVLGRFFPQTGYFIANKELFVNFHTFTVKTGFTPGGMHQARAEGGTSRFLGFMAAECVTEEPLRVKAELAAIKSSMRGAYVLGETPFNLMVAPLNRHNFSRTVGTASPRFIAGVALVAMVLKPATMISSSATCWAGLEGGGRGASICGKRSLVGWVPAGQFTASGV